MTTAILAVVLTLDAALAMARAHQPQLVQAAAATQAAEARADGASVLGQLRHPAIPV